MIAGLICGAWNYNKVKFSRKTWIFFLCGCFYFQFCCACLVVFSGTRGSTIFAAYLLFVAGYHGYNWRVTIREFFFPLGTIFVTLSAVPLHPSEEKWALLGFVGCTAAIAELIIGTNARRWAIEKQRTSQLQSAFQAQLLTDQSRELERLSEKLIEVFGLNHDLNNALMATNLHAEMVFDRSHVVDDASLKHAARELETSLEQMNQLVSNLVMEGRRLRATSLEEVEIQPVLDPVGLHIRARFPSVQLHFPSGSEPLKVLIRGGRPTLHRIIENLLINACEGDGKVGAKSIDLQMHRDSSSSRVNLIFRDDGPGFSFEQLARKVQAFTTNKPHGTGLGLYTSERLVMASSGVLIRENRPEGGAQVSVSLPIGS
jgi:two-component system C4-dicarboxylate transport sensor histidine kinase DctB